MAKQLKLRRGTTSQHSSFTGAEGEVTVDTTKDTLVVHDGSTAGGTPLAKESAIPSAYTHPNHSGEVTSTGDGATVIADNVVDEANLKVSNSPTNGQVLTARSGNTGGMTWETTSSVGGATGVDFNDDVKARWGTGNDLEIYHSSNNNYIKGGVQNIYVDSSSSIVLSNGSGGTISSFMPSSINHYQHIYLNNSKNLTVSGGYITCSGNISVTGSGKFSGDGSLLTNTPAPSTNTYHSLYMGANSGEDTTASATDNVAIGRSAGKELTSGNKNTIIGSLAGANSTTGFRNIILGYGACGSGNLTGSSNVVIGSYETGKLMTSADSNVFIGGRCAQAITTGDENTAVGRNCMTTMTNGGFNVALGASSFGNNGGSHNIAIGAYTLGRNIYDGSNVGGSYNVAICAGSLSRNKGGYSVGIGYNTLHNHTTADDALAIGTYASEKLTTGTLVTAIGNEANRYGTTGYGGVFIGHHSGRGNSTATDVTHQTNTAVGAYTLEAVRAGKDNVAIGYGAGQSLEYAERSVLIGFNAGHNIEGGSDNICIGYKAGEALTSYHGNAFIGYQSGRQATSAVYNQGLGHHSLNSLTTGDRNVGIGMEAGGSITTGEYNTCIGAGTGGPSGGSYNVAIGTKCSSGSDSGYTKNVQIGYESMKEYGGYQTTESTTVGSQSAYKLITGHRATAFGAKSLYNIHSGSDNTGIGYEAGYDITNGSNCTFIGHDSGKSGSPSGSVTTGSNVICLGDNNVTDLYCADTSISSSDKRDKTDVTDFTHGLKWVEQLKPVTYKWDKRSWYSDDLSATPDGSKKKAKQHIGFLAQDVLAIEQADGFASKKDDMLVVNLNEDDTAYGLKYERLVPVLVNAIKELSAKVKALEAK